MKILIPTYVLFFILKASASEMPFEVNRDSIAAYTNIEILYAYKISSLDTLYCDELDPVTVEEIGNRIQITRFNCNHSSVTSFTFLKYENEFAIVQFKPDKSEHETFSQARLSLKNISKVYKMSNMDVQKDGVTATEFSKGVKVAAVSMLVVLTLSVVMLLTIFYNDVKSTL